MGDIGRTIVAVLSDAGTEMRLKDIHVEVEERLGRRVSFYSAADYLHKRSRGAKPLFLRTRYGHYILRQ